MALLVPLGSRDSQAHIVPEEPWHPVPAAYLRALFYAGQQPVDWSLIANEFESVADSDIDTLLDSAYAGLKPANTISGIDHEAEIRAAIQLQDKQALYVTASRALSQLVRYELSVAADLLTEPGAATEAVQQAQRYYRAFGSFITQTDDEEARQLGRAWLDLSSSVGHAGVNNVGGSVPEPERFALARTIIEDYLVESFELNEYANASLMAPVPANVRDHSVTIEPWLPPGSNINDQDPLPLLALNFEERGIDEADLPLIAYGDMLFDSPFIFGEPARSMGIACSTCHNRSDINKDFFIPGVSHQAGAADVDGGFFNPMFNDHRSDSLDIPTLRGIRFTGPYGRDGRFGSLSDFTRNVIVNEFGGEEPTPFMMDALVAYMLEFDWQPNSMLDQDGTLNANAPEAARRGEIIFNSPFAGMNNQSCGTCHIPSANFIDRLPHDIRSGDPASEFARDSAFDTPTLINVASTGPYFHDGSLETLADVVDWFDTNFGLALDDQDRQDLVIYLETVGAADTPWELFDDQNTRFALDWAELSTFLSTLDVLIQAEDTYHTQLLLDTVSSDLRLDASGATDRSVIPLANQIADKLDELKEAVASGDWELAAVLNEEYKVLATEAGPIFR